MKFKAYKIWTKNGIVWTHDKIMADFMYKTLPWWKKILLWFLF